MLPGGLSWTIAAVSSRDDPRARRGIPVQHAPDGGFAARAVAVRDAPDRIGSDRIGSILYHPRTAPRVRLP